MEDGSINFRMAAHGDWHQLAELRWHLKTDDDSTSGAEQIQFVKDCSEGFKRLDAAGQTVHWIATQDDIIIAAMTVVKVTKMPSPGRLDRQWGYLTNCYVCPEYRNQAVGSQLLSRIKLWSKQEGLELLIVWPSEQAFPFYERSGFERPDDPLVLEF